MGSEALKLHKKHRGKIAVVSKVPLKTKKDLSLAYTPGVADASTEISRNTEKTYEYTSKWNLVAIISDGTAVLGLGDTGPEAALPVMEGKAILFKEFGNVDAFPICVKTKDVDEIVKLVSLLEPTFGGINLEDISAPRCFEIEERLRKEMKIPVFHDDQHGTAIVVLAGLINAAKVVGKQMKDLKIVISGAGAAGIAITKILLSYGVSDIILLDSKGIIYRGRKKGMNKIKKRISKLINKKGLKGGLPESMIGADVFIGVSKPRIVKKEMIKSMNKDPIIFAMANPIPEIYPSEAKIGGAKVIATGRSDFPNQVNNVLAFPGVFRGALDIRTKQITEKMKVAAAEAIASYIKKPTADNIIPSALDKNVARVVANAIKRI